jgi:hypothetical protein
MRDRRRRLATRFGGVATRTRDATATTLRRRDGRLVFLSVTAAYLLGYLWAIGHLAPGLGGYEVSVAANPLGRFFRPELGPFTYTPVARIALGPVTYLFSLNTILGVGLAALVGVNLALTYVVWTQPRACGVGQSSTGVVASVPALLSGTACCGPVVAIVLGIQLSGAVLTAFQFLLPVAGLLLVGSLVLTARQVDGRYGRL